ncbi:hypothetical protein BDV98DRAFT_510664 [Pterulicium gracile]|uniref:Enoyl reductase (ER) domain-containing protein n=1 Tax=Pterulicium gracile TaxID=1884261 RepID=A0A5C3QAX7_9AGAR|nr:hypothetical protein BDV98DRAFT_510664 [Pterula gracilis]
MSAIPKLSKAILLQNSPTERTDLRLTGDSSSTFKLVERDLPKLKDGQYLLKTVYLSNDPAQRTWIQKNANPARSYLPPINPGEVMRAMGVGQVVASKSSGIQVGDLVYGMLGWKDYGVFDEQSTSRSAIPIPGHSPSIFLGAFGGTGLTAYFGLTEILKLQKGQSLVVSGAAGAVGNMVVQYAKHVIGASKVVAISGSDEKAAWVEKLGADVSLNYKSSEFKKQLDDATEGFVDAYFDNGEILDQMLTRVKQGGRIAACGAISVYNSSEPTRLFNYMNLITYRITLQGFIVIDYLHRSDEAVAALSSALKKGKIDIQDAETLVQAQFEEIPKTWGLLFEGGNTGKLITQITSLD